MPIATATHPLWFVRFPRFNAVSGLDASELSGPFKTRAAAREEAGPLGEIIRRPLLLESSAFLPVRKPAARRRLGPRLSKGPK